MSVKKAVKLSLAEQSLRMWCVEQAIKWPQVLTYPSAVGQHLQSMPYSTGGYVDADVPARAEKLRVWVSGVKA